jgi:putative addiction module CopG family antidote
MTVSLPRKLADFVERQVKSGRFDSATDVVASALARLQTEQEFSSKEFAELRAHINVGLEQSARGESQQWDVSELRAEGQRLLKNSTRDRKHAASKKNSRSKG